jgi:hypothetical protein
MMTKYVDVNPMNRERLRVMRIIETVGSSYTSKFNHQIATSVSAANKCFSHTNIQIFLGECRLTNTKV